MLQIKRLTDCTIQEGVKAWNNGFEGYFFDVTTTAEKFVNRIASEGLSPDLSLVAFWDREPIGIVMHGVRYFQGKKLAWNGGTGVAKNYRHQGNGKKLIEASTELLRKENVNVATLEAISENDKAISLYKDTGYHIVDHLEYLELKGSLQENPIQSNQSYIVEKVHPQQIGTLSFYKGMNPWQTHWQYAKEGEAYIVKDEHHQVIGYTYFKKTYNEEAKHISTILYQCEAEPSRKDQAEIITFLLSTVFSSFSEDIRRIVPNVPIKKSELTYSILKDIGFQPFVKQVFMIKEL